MKGKHSYSINPNLKTEGLGNETEERITNYRMKETGKGALKGLGIGALTGAAGGSLLGLATKRKLAPLAGIGSVLAAPFGGLIGASRAHDRTDKEHKDFIMKIYMASKLLDHGIEPAIVPSSELDLAALNIPDVKKDAFRKGFEKSAMSADTLHHAIEVAGLGTLVAPNVYHMATRKNMKPKTIDKLEIAGLGTLAAPSLYSLGKKLIRRGK